MSAPSRLSAVLDGLVSDARSTRDGVFNTLDAVDRRTKLSSESMARQVQRFMAEQAAAVRAERDAATSDDDARFDPEDEWDVPGPAAVASGAAAARGQAVRGDGDRSGGGGSGDDTVRDADDETDNYPDTWLR